jgi:hypothetical protein
MPRKKPSRRTSKNKNSSVANLDLEPLDEAALASLKQIPLEIELPQKRDAIEEAHMQ